MVKVFHNSVKDWYLFCKAHIWFLWSICSEHLMKDIWRYVRYMTLTWIFLLSKLLNKLPCVNHTMYSNYKAALDNVVVSKHLHFYVFFLLLRGWSSVRGLIYLLRCLLFIAWHTNCNTKLVSSFLLLQIFLRGDY